jgi:predicted ATPase
LGPAYASVPGRPGAKTTGELPKASIRDKGCGRRVLFSSNAIGENPSCRWIRASQPPTNFRATRTSTMLTSIKYDKHHLHLGNRSPEKNIFSINSISLLIGANGSGKTRFMQAIVAAFDAEAHYRLNRCKLFLHDQTEDYRPVKALWGVVYYTPVQNRPTFRAHEDFVDASKVPPRNIFELLEYDELFTDFGLKVKLVARASVEYRRICEEFASALIDNPDFRSSDAADEFDNARHAKERHKATSHYRDDQTTILELEKNDKKLHQELTEKIYKDFQEKCPEEKKLASAMLVIQHMFSRSNINQLLDFAKNYIGSKFINTIFTSEKPLRFLALARLAEKQLQTGKLERTDSHYNYEYVIKHPKRERKYFETPNIAKLFKPELDNVSSGEWALLNQIIALHESIEKLHHKNNLVVLIDEGDAFLHLNWQRQYVYQLDRFLEKCKHRFAIANIQLILASHSPILASDIPRTFICHMEANSTNSQRETLPPTFAAPLQSILNLAFTSSTIGEFATRTINKTIKNLRNNDRSEWERDDYVISIIDDPTIKQVLTEMRDGVDSQ